MRQGILFRVFLDSENEEQWCSHCFRELLGTVRNPATLLYISGKRSVISDAHCDHCHESAGCAKAKKAASALLKDIKEGKYA